MKRLTVDEVADQLGRNPELVRRWLRTGRLKGEHVGWVWTVTLREVERFMKAQPQRRRR